MENIELSQREYVADELTDSLRRPLKRKIYRELLAWKEKRQGKTALLIEGARRIGKTTVVREFAKNEYKSAIIIDFSKVSKEILDIFEDGQGNFDLFFNMLEVAFAVKLVPRESLIVFDEVQLYPKARQMIKHLVEDGRYDYIETGSLISIRKNVQDILIPSEEEKIRMYPLDFEEFLWANGNDATMPYLRQCYEERRPVGAVHRQIMRDFRAYILVGGMPQAVVEYVATHDFEEVDNIKRGILSLYHDDIKKYADGEDEKVVAIFDNIPGQLSKKSKRFMLASISENARSRSYEAAFKWLAESMMANLCFNVTDPNVGLKLTEDLTSLKCYLGDTGLLVTQAFVNKPYLDNEIYRSILLDKLSVNEGMIMENYVASALRVSRYELFYYAVNDNANREKDMEIDFLISQGQKINPIEVKSGDYNKHSSIDKFKRKFGRQVGVRYVLHPKDLKVQDDIVYLPLYMAGLL